MIPYQREYWTFHDNKHSNLGMFDAYRLRFISEYQDIYPFREADNGFAHRDEYEQVKAEAKKELDALIDAGRMDEVCGLLHMPENQGHLVLKELELICRIYVAEKELGLHSAIYKRNMSSTEVYARPNRLRHLVKRVEFQHGNFEEIVIELSEHYSSCAVTAVILTYGMWRRSLYEKLLSGYQKNDGKQYREYLGYRELFEHEDLADE